MHSLRSSFLLSFAFLSLLFLSGCSHYEWSRPAPPFKTIYVQPATNDSSAPQAQASLSAQIRQVLIRDGRVRLVSKPTEADAILQINLTDYRRDSAIRSSEDSELALGFDLVLEARIALFDPSTSKYLIKARDLSANTSTFASDPITGEDNFSLSEYQAMPRLTEDLANSIADEILGVW